MQCWIVGTHVAATFRYMPKMADTWQGRPVLRWFRLFRIYALHWLAALSFLFLYIALTFGWFIGDLILLQSSWGTAFRSARALILI